MKKTINIATSKLEDPLEVGSVNGLIQPKGTYTLTQVEIEKGTKVDINGIVYDWTGEEIITYEKEQDTQ